MPEIQPDTYTCIPQKTIVYQHFLQIHRKPLTSNFHFCTGYYIHLYSSDEYGNVVRSNVINRKAELIYFS